MNVNLVILIGRVATQPVHQNNRTYFRLVINEKYKEHEKTTGVTIVCFRRLAEVVNEYVTVGDLLYVQGKIDVYKNDAGEWFTSIVANSVQFAPKQLKHAEAQREYHVERPRKISSHTPEDTDRDAHASDLRQNERSESSDVFDFEEDDLPF